MSDMDGVDTTSDEKSLDEMPQFDEAQSGGSPPPMPSSVLS